MENPKSWTPLHHEVDSAMYNHDIQKVAALLNTDGHKITEAIEQFNKNIDSGIIGPSLTAFLVGKFKLK